MSDEERQSPPRHTVDGVTQAGPRSANGRERSAKARHLNNEKRPATQRGPGKRAPSNVAAACIPNRTTIEGRGSRRSLPPNHQPAVRLTNASRGLLPKPAGRRSAESRRNRDSVLLRQLDELAALGPSRGAMAAQPVRDRAWGDLEGIGKPAIRPLLPTLSALDGLDDARPACVAAPGLGAGAAAPPIGRSRAGARALRSLPPASCRADSCTSTAPP